MGQHILKVAAFDLGVNFSIFRAGITDKGVIEPLSCNTWSLTGNDEDRYTEFHQIIIAAVSWADAVAYEHVQFNRGKSLIEGFRSVLIVECAQKDIFCAGVNVATLKKFAIKGRWPDTKDREKKGKKKIEGKKKMELALAFDYPEFIDKIDLYLKDKKKGRDDVIDAAWVSIWLLSKVDLL